MASGGYRILDTMTPGAAPRWSEPLGTSCAPYPFLFLRSPSASEGVAWRDP
jgi:hypothetical protein